MKFLLTEKELDNLISERLKEVLEIEKRKLENQYFKENKLIKERRDEWKNKAERMQKFFIDTNKVMQSIIEKGIEKY